MHSAWARTEQRGQTLSCRPSSGDKLATGLGWLEPSDRQGRNRNQRRVAHGEESRHWGQTAWFAARPSPTAPWARVSPACATTGTAAGPSHRVAVTTQQGSCYVRHTTQVSHCRCDSCTSTKASGAHVGHGIPFIRTVSQERRSYATVTKAQIPGAYKTTKVYFSLIQHTPNGSAVALRCHRVRLMGQPASGTLPIAVAERREQGLLLALRVSAWT